MLILKIKKLIKEKKTYSVIELFINITTNYQSFVRIFTFVGMYVPTIPCNTRNIISASELVRYNRIFESKHIVLNFEVLQTNDHKSKIYLKKNRNMIYYLGAY